MPSTTRVALALALVACPAASAASAQDEVITVDLQARGRKDDPVGYSKPPALASVPITLLGTTTRAAAPGAPSNRGPAAEDRRRDPIRGRTLRWTTR